MRNIARGGGRIAREIKIQRPSRNLYWRVKSPIKSTLEVPWRMRGSHCARSDTIIGHRACYDGASNFHAAYYSKSCGACKDRAAHKAKTLLAIARPPRARSRPTPQASRREGGSSRRTQGQAEPGNISIAASPQGNDVSLQRRVGAPPTGGRADLTGGRTLTGTSGRVLLCAPSASNPRERAQWRGVPALPRARVGVAGQALARGTSAIQPSGDTANPCARSMLHHGETTAHSMFA